MKQLMARKSSLTNSRSALIAAVLAVFALSFALTYSFARLRNHSPKPPASVTLTATDKDRDGLIGAVRKVRTEVTRLSNKSGDFVESPRELMETTIYNPDGKIIESAYYPVSTNSKPGKEEYTYDDKGNISTKTVLDSNSSVVSKESYAYEYDRVGNWTKSIASRLVYEDGKVIQKPAEAIYRNIIYYVDQSAAGKAFALSSAKQNPEQERAALVALQSALNTWIAATNARDIEKLMSFYDSTIEVFYLARNVPASLVRAEKLRLFQRSVPLDIHAGAPEITLGFDRQTATMRFRKSYLVQGVNGIREAAVLQQLRWQQTATGWKIIGERDEQIIP